jgi:hypothetical protein
MRIAEKTSEKHVNIRALAGGHLQTVKWGIENVSYEPYKQRKDPPKPRPRPGRATRRDQQFCLWWVSKIIEKSKNLET